ncbi:MAG: hypothetical protein ACKVX9_08945 [Blastocatellia bacterium]
MFITLLLVTFLIAALTSTIVMLLFYRPVRKILGRLVSEDLAPAWQRYILFAIYVVGISGGVRVWDVEKYISPDKTGQILTLNSERWAIEVYKTVIGSLQSIATMLLVFFLIALLAYVVVRGFELWRTKTTPAVE